MPCLQEDTSNNENLFVKDSGMNWGFQGFGLLDVCFRRSEVTVVDFGKLLPGDSKVYRACLFVI